MAEIIGSAPYRSCLSLVKSGKGNLGLSKGSRKQLFLFRRSLSNCLTLVYVLTVVFGACQRTDGFVLVLLL